MKSILKHVSPNWIILVVGFALFLCLTGIHLGMATLIAWLAATLGAALACVIMIVRRVDGDSYLNSKWDRWVAIDIVSLVALFLLLKYNPKVWIKYFV